MTRLYKEKTCKLADIFEDLWVPLGPKISYSELFQAKISESMICGFNDKLFANKFEKGRFSLQYIFFLFTTLNQHSKKT